MQEGTNLEFKADFSRSFLKTVSAFANYDGGQIIFGIDDNGKALGVSNPKELCLQIENSINDALEPIPTYSISPEEKNGKTLIRVKVLQGVDTPYYALGKAYKRHHTSTVKVDASELKRLVLKGINTSFEECPAKDQALSFVLLNRALEKKLDINAVDEKVYRTLGLYTTAHGFNNAAAILADKNDFPGVDIVKFGKSINEFMERRTKENVSALELYDESIAIFNRYYKFESIDGFKREEDSLVPVTAYREAVANALVHRDWAVNGHIRISLYNDRVEISSPGGLPHGVSEEDYLAGRLSVLRNPIIADVFAKLGHIEKFGTGIPRIKASYEGSGLAPRFFISSTSITVVLPSTSSLDGVNEAERRVLKLLGEYGALKRSEIEEYLDVSKSKVNRILKRLEENELIKAEGAGRATKYKL